MEYEKYEEIALLKQSEKSAVYLVYEKDGEQVFVKKILKGRHNIYLTLLECEHPNLPKLYEAVVSDDATIVIEEYVEGQSLGSAELSEKQLLGAIYELCSVLGFLHEKGIIHRDIKPSNIIFAKDGHIRLIDFDAARMPNDDFEQDTYPLGTRGYAPPEQYGFAQTDVRSDIYSLGVTLKQLLGNKARKLRYRGIVRKCMDLNPNKRYRSAEQVKRAFFHAKRSVWYGCAVFLGGGILLWYIISHTVPSPHGMDDLDNASSYHAGKEQEEVQAQNAEPIVLPAPENPHWNDETGIAVWGNVPDSGVDGEVSYSWRLYRKDDAVPPTPEEITWELEGGMRGNGHIGDAFSTYEVNLADRLWENGFYYFAVSADGDGVHYADSPYAISDAFEYTGDSAPPLPMPTDLEWRIIENDLDWQPYAVWSNLDEYEDKDSFNVRVYNESGNMVRNNIWTKEQILSLEHGGIWIDPAFLTEEGGAYRFTVQAYTSRPNEYRSTYTPDPVPEEYFSPWFSPADDLRHGWGKEHK